MKRATTPSAVALGKWLSSVKRSHTMVWRSGSRQWVGEVLARLEGWCATLEDPRDGCDLLFRFYQGDDALFSHCDDSNGDLGDLFRNEAKALFTGYARNCPDKDWIAAELFALLQDDGYGVRDTLLEGAREFLPEAALRDLVRKFQAVPEVGSDDPRKPLGGIYIEMLARELRDPVLFEEARIRSWGNLNPAAHLDIAQIWFECGNAGAARKWLDSVPQGDNFKGEERDELLIRVAAAQGDAAARDAAAWRRFRRDRSRTGLDVLLQVIGVDQKATALAQECRQILDAPALQVSDALFLLEMGFTDAAEAYLLERISQVSGDHYGEMLDLAEATVQHGLALVASLLYRALLESILVHVRRTAYRHAAKYLSNLSRLARTVTDWRGHPSHQVFVVELRKRHGNKKAFWALVD
jgi:hypothetical protein